MWFLSSSHLYGKKLISRRLIIFICFNKLRQKIFGNSQYFKQNELKTMYASFSFIFSFFIVFLFFLTRILKASFNLTPLLSRRPPALPVPPLPAAAPPFLPPASPEPTSSSSQRWRPWAFARPAWSKCSGRCFSFDQPPSAQGYATRRRL